MGNVSLGRFSRMTSISRCLHSSASRSHSPTFSMGAVPRLVNRLNTAQSIVLALGCVNKFDRTNLPTWWSLILAYVQSIAKRWWMRRSPWRIFFGCDDGPINDMP